MDKQKKVHQRKKGSKSRTGKGNRDAGQTHHNTADTLMRRNTFYKRRAQKPCVIMLRKNGQSK
jgi:hypothetical protein